MLNRFGITPARVWSAGWLALIVYLGAGLGSLRAQEPVPAGTAGPGHVQVARPPAPDAGAVPSGDSLNQALAGVRARLGRLEELVETAVARQDQPSAVEPDPRVQAPIEALKADRDRLLDALRRARAAAKVRDETNAQLRRLVEELIGERRENVQLGAELAKAKTARAVVEKAARAKEAALTAWIGGLRDELARREAALAEAVAAQAEARSVRRRLARLQDQLHERDRESAAVRAEAEDLRQRLDAAENELKRVGAESDRLAAELAAARTAAVLATAQAQENLAVIETQIVVLRAAAADGPSARREPAGKLVSAALLEALPAMPYPKPRLQDVETDAWLTPVASADRGAPVVAAAAAVIEDDPWIHAGLLAPGAPSGAPPAPDARAAAPEQPEILDLMTTAALAPEHFGSDLVMPDESSPLDQSGGPMERVGQSSLNDAAARLADGLLAARADAVSQGEERVFTLDVEERAFAADAAGRVVLLDPALDVQLFTARSELVGRGKGGIRFFPDGSSTGGRIELGLLGERAAVNVQWSTGAVMVER